MANSLTKEEYITFSENLKSEFNVTMLNPLSNELKVMRQSLLFSGLESISYNINRKNSSLKLYEFGKTYHKYERDIKKINILPYLSQELKQRIVGLMYLRTQISFI
jgi:phenylalanyl-tRNA synthetase beta chain